MQIINLSSHQELLNYLEKNKNSYILIYKEGSEQSDCSLKNIENIDKIKNVNIYKVNVSDVKDIHKNYNITSAPTLLHFEKNNLIKTIKGCNTSDYYKSLFENSLFATEKNTNNKPSQKPVLVYSTPTCSWCNRIKQHFKEKNIKFRDINVSKDQKAAEQMVKRSGQQGVPQTNIGGQIVIGFDKNKINQLLNIK
ncbi:MAG: thioredoxin family protein [Bacteroidota bacterium]|nr:thioredoxin family protein [Bacteroidota bacterium]